MRVVSLSRRWLRVRRRAAPSCLSDGPPPGLCADLLRRGRSRRWTAFHVPLLRPRTRALGVLVSSGLIALALSACGSSSPASSSSLSAKQQGCTAVSDVLADGPDPDVDSVGYAEAQVLPLRQLKLADATLAHVVDQLDAAYKSFSSSNGTKGTSAAMKVSAAEKAVNAICPNAAP
jgi:hypothetical protein